MSTEIEAQIKALESAYDLGISDFKASLREEIEKVLKDNAVSDNANKGLLIALQLLDTVKPKTA